MWRCTSCGRVWRHWVTTPVSNSNQVFGVLRFQAGFPHGNRNKTHSWRGGRPIFTYMLNQSNSESWVGRFNFFFFQTTLKIKGSKDVFATFVLSLNKGKVAFSEQLSRELWLKATYLVATVTSYSNSVNNTGSNLQPQSATMEANTKWKNVSYWYYKQL